MKQIVIIALAALVYAAGSLADASPADANEPEALLQTWLTALVDEDYPAYTDCLYREARGVPEYGSREAMRFWAKEIDQLRKRGFDGHFEIESVADGRARFPEGTLLAHPIVDGKATRDAIVLIQEAGRWKILRLFS